MINRRLPLRMQLNTFYSGPQAWFFLAEERGYLRDEGLEIEFTEGDTAANTIPKMAAGGFDVGYGDINALITHAANGLPAKGMSPWPVAVFASYNASPYTIAVPATSNIRTPQDLQGKLLAAHPQDAAMLLFPEFCKKTGLDESTVRTVIDAAPHSTMVPDLLAGKWDGMFGFVNTLIAASIDAGVDPKALRYIEYHDHVPELYGMALMVSRELATTEPDIVRKLLRAFNRGLKDTIADPNAAIDALAKRNPAINRESNLRRLLGTLQLEMGRAEGGVLGIGDLDDVRFARGIDLLVNTKNLPHHPKARDLFDRSFLPPLTDRVRNLVRA
jgi:NitT/TauT family transport system substrate-binding protein